MSYSAPSLWRPLGVYFDDSRSNISSWSAVVEYFFAFYPGFRAK